MPRTSKLAVSPFTPVPFSLEQLPLASLVRNLQEPNVETWSSSWSLEDPAYKSLVWRNQHDISQTSTGSGSTSHFLLQATKWFEGSLSRQKLESMTIDAIEGYEYKLRQPAAAFKSICTNSQSAKEWMQTAIEEGVVKKQGVHFVVGWRTFVDTDLQLERQKVANMKAQGTAPAAAAAGLPDAGGLVDVKTAIQHDTHEESSNWFHVPGERIYMIYYRKVKFGKAGVEKLSLGSTRWRLTTDNRSGADTEGEPVYIEVDLEDDVEEVESEQKGL